MRGFFRIFFAISVIVPAVHAAESASEEKRGDSYVPAGYRQVWGDDFEGKELDSRKWTLRADMGGLADLTLAGTSRPDVLRVADGKLQLNVVADRNQENGKMHYTTCLSVTTFNKMHFKYGYLEMRARVPFEQGCWPSFWMKSLPGDISPESRVSYMAEVDVFEVFSSRDKLIPNLHKWHKNRKHTQSSRRTPYQFADPEGLSDEYHTYGFEWTPEEMSMFVDGRKYVTFDLSDDFDGEGGMGGFHEPLYVIFNNHIFTGASPWRPEGALVDETTPFPLSYWIEWIHLYQKPGVGELYTAR